MRMRRAAASVDNTSGHERTRSFDNDAHTALVLEIDDAQARAERKRSVRRSCLLIVASPEATRGNAVHKLDIADSSALEPKPQNATIQ